MAQRISQDAVLVEGTGSPAAHISQDAILVEGTGSPTARVSQVAVLVLVRVQPIKPFIFCVT